MRLVDLLLTPRQTTSLPPSFGGQSRETGGPIWMTTTHGPSPTPPTSARRSPITHQNADTNKTNHRYYSNAHDSPAHRQVANKSSSSSRSVGGALSDLLRSTRSPTAPGYRNQSTPVVPLIPSSPCVTTELSRLLLQPDSIQAETLASLDDDGGSHFYQIGRVQEGSGVAAAPHHIKPEVVTKLDKNLNCTMWKTEGSFRVGCSSTFSSSTSLSSPSSSSSSSSSSSKSPSIGEGPSSSRFPFGRRRVSLLSSDGSDLDPRDHILSTMADSDCSHEESSLASPLEDLEASRWMVDPVVAASSYSSSAGYGDWQNLDDDGMLLQERESYDIFDSYQLFNFNILGNSLEDADSPFTPFDGNYLLPADDNIAFGNDSLVAMVPGVTATSIATDPGSKYDAANLKQQTPSGCHDYKPHGMNNIAENMVQAQFSISNGAMRHQSTINGDTIFLAPSSYSSSILSSASSDNEPRSTNTSPPQSEVVKLLLQNRRQWVPPAEKPPTHVAGYRGSRKRAQGTSARETTTRVKAPRSSNRLVPPPVERRHSVPSLPRKVAPFVSTNSLHHLEDDQSSSTSLERLITELILLEQSESNNNNACSSSRNPSDPNADDLQCSAWTTKQEQRDVVVVEQPGSFAEELFEGLINVCPTSSSDSDLFSNLELESIYSGDCGAEMLALQEATRFQESIECFNVVIKSDPEMMTMAAGSPSPPSLPPPTPHSTWKQECFPFPENGFCSGKTTASLSAQHERMLNEINGNSTDLEAAALDGVLQSKLFLDSPSPPACCSESPLRSAEQAIVDHDYCQTDALSSTDECLNGDDGSVEPAWLSKRRRQQQSKCCLNRGSSDCSALKSLLLDSNLTEEVRKEVEVVRAKSRKNMSERRTAPVITEPLRALRCGGGGGKGVYDDGDLLTAEGESPLRLLYKNLTALNGCQLNLKSIFEQLLSNSDEVKRNLEVEVEEGVTDATDCLSRVTGSFDPCQTLPLGVTTEKREVSEDVGFELSTPLTSSHLDLSSGGDDGGGDMENNVIFFDSFEEFYLSSSNSNNSSSISSSNSSNSISSNSSNSSSNSSNSTSSSRSGQDLDPTTAELQLEEHSDSSSPSESLTAQSESSNHQTISIANFKKPRSRYNSLKKKRTNQQVITRRDSSLSRRDSSSRGRAALRNGQAIIRRQNTQPVTPMGCAVLHRNVRRKPKLLNEKHRLLGGYGRLQTV